MLIIVGISLILIAILGVMVFRSRKYRSSQPRWDEMSREEIRSTLAAQAEYKPNLVRTRHSIESQNPNRY